MKNLKYFIIGFVIIDIIVIVVIMLFLFGTQKDRCLDNRGMWYQDTCITKGSSADKLMKVGLLEEVKNESVEVKVSYPIEILNFTKIFDNLKNRVVDIKMESGFDNPEVDTSNLWQLNIEMDNFKVSGDVATVFGKVFTYTGGAHPNHTFITINFDTRDQNIIDLNYLFSDKEDALEAISKYVIQDLYKQKAERLGKKISNDEWFTNGASAADDNYKDFIFISSEQKNNSAGLVFIFSPYTVGSYAEGSYMVYVPTNIFYEHLNEKSKNYFSVNSKPNKTILREIIN